MSLLLCLGGAAYTPPTRRLETNLEPREGVQRAIRGCLGRLPAATLGVGAALLRGLAVGDDPSVDGAR